MFLMGPDSLMDGPLDPVIRPAHKAPCGVLSPGTARSQGGWVQPSSRRMAGPRHRIRRPATSTFKTPGACPLRVAGRSVIHRKCPARANVRSPPVVDIGERHELSRKVASDRESVQARPVSLPFVRDTLAVPVFSAP